MCCRKDGSGKNERHLGRTYKLMLEAMTLVAPVSLAVVLYIVLPCRYVTGFPVPFLHLICGFPGYFMTFLGCFVLLRGLGAYLDLAWCTNLRSHGTLIAS